MSSGLTICSAKQVCVLSAVSSQTHPSRIFISPSFVVLCCVLCAVCKRNAKAGAAPNSGLRLLRIMLRLPRTQTLLGAVLLSSAALVCASFGLCSVCSRADTVFFSLHWFSCFRSLPPPASRGCRCAVTLIPTAATLGLTRSDYPRKHWLRSGLTH